MVRYLLYPLSPAIRWMRQLHLPTKLGLLGLMLLLPLFVVAIARHQTLSADIDAVTLGLEGSVAVAALVTLAAEVQASRGLTQTLLTGDASAGAERDQARQRMRQALQTVDALVAKGSRFEFPKDWPALREAATALAEGRHAQRREAAFEEHRLVVDRTRRLIFNVAEASSLLLDPMRDTALQVNMTVEYLLPWSEGLAATRGLAAPVLARGEANGRDRATMLAAVAGIGRQTEELELRMGALARTGAAVPKGWLPAKAAADAFAKLTQDGFSADIVKLDAKAHYAIGAQAVDLAHGLHQQVIQIGRASCRERV